MAIETSRTPATKMQNLLAVLEIEQEKRELRELGLTAEEVEGCIEFFIDNYLEDSNDLQISVPSLFTRTRGLA